MRAAVVQQSLHQRSHVILMQHRQHNRGNLPAETPRRPGLWSRRILRRQKAAVHLCDDALPGFRGSVDLGLFFTVLLACANDDNLSQPSESLGCQYRLNDGRSPADPSIEASSGSTAGCGSAVACVLQHIIALRGSRAAREAGGRLHAPLSTTSSMSPLLVKACSMLWAEFGMSIGTLVCFEQMSNCEMIELPIVVRVNRCIPAQSL